MTIKVDHVWNGRSHLFRITLPNGQRETILDPGGWDKQTASTALNLLEDIYGLVRRNIRFVVN